MGSEEGEEVMSVHLTRQIKVTVNVDEGIADFVEYLQTIPGVRTHASCQGSIGEGGAEPYSAYVRASWDDTAFLLLLADKNIVVQVLGDHHGTLHPVIGVGLK